MVTLGVISDTHIPDRARQLHPQVMPRFQSARVDAILHAGDVSVPGVLEQLSQIAPVYAVRGNRDWMMLRHLPKSLQLTFEGVTIGMTHGHGRWWNYVVDRSRTVMFGYREEYYLPRIPSLMPGVRVIVFGHIHYPHNEWVDGQLLFNPGSPHFPDNFTDIPSIGLLHIYGESVAGEIVELSQEWE